MSIYAKVSIYCLALCLSALVHAEEEWVDLIQDDLSNWDIKGGEATYRIEDGAVVGTSAPNTQNTFLCTKETYGDFILEFEFMGHEELNSGVQIRSESKEDFKNYRVHGYQVELEEDNHDRDWHGGIYDEGRRGWLYPANGDEAAGQAFGEVGKQAWKPGEWNHIRVEAKGDRIRTWLNGEPRADLQDDMTLSGFIALQVHGVGNKTEPMSVRWRNVRVKRLD